LESALKREPMLGRLLMPARNARGARATLLRRQGRFDEAALDAKRWGELDKGLASGLPGPAR
jgi:hypothetical protein